MILKGKNKLLAIMLSLAMVFTMMPMMGAPAYADDPAPPAPGIATGPDVLNVGLNTSGAAAVYMAGTRWRVIGYAGAGVASTEADPEVLDSTDTMTLIAADNLIPAIQFNPNSNRVNTYKESILHQVVNGHTYGIFSPGEIAGIVPKDLEHGDYTDSSPYTNGISGEKVEGALLWPLSTQEAYNMDSDLRITNDWWWLRSPGSNDNSAAYVESEGLISPEGDFVNITAGVRPAFNFDLKSVIFTSATTEGKSDDVGALTQVGENLRGEWKLTLKDKVHEDFKVDSVTRKDETTLKITYSEAKKGDNEYVSAIIKDRYDMVKYYGKLALASDEDGAEATVNIGGKMEEGDKLCIFNEQCNHIHRTDFSSPLQEITIPCVHHQYDEKDTTNEIIYDEGKKPGDAGYVIDRYTFTCAKCGTKETKDANIMEEPFEKPTCEEKGSYLYVSSLSKEESLDGEPKTNSFSAEIAPLGHEWSAEFRWTGDETNGYTKAEANYACSRCEKTETVEAGLEKSVTEPSCETGGKTTYTATVSAEKSPDKEAHSDSKDTKITGALGHDWQYAAAGNVITADCLRCHEHATLTLNAEDKVYDGTPAAAEVVKSENWTDEKGLIQPVLRYYNTYKAGGGKYNGSTLLAPTNVCRCEASIEIKKDSTTYTAKKEFRITERPLTITAKDQTCEYDGKDHGPGEAAYTGADKVAEVVDADGLAEGETLTGIEVSGQGNAAGTYELQPGAAQINNDAEAKENYDIEYLNGKLTITPAPLTVNVSGSSEAKTYNGEEQIYVGMVTAASDDPAFDVSKFSYKGNVTVNGTNAGDYEIPLSEQDCAYDDRNYKVNWVIDDPIRLGIDKAAIIIKADDKTCRDLDRTDPLSWTVTDGEWYEFKAPEIAFDVVDDKGISVDPKTAPEGKYTIVPSWKTENKNYEATFKEGIFDTTHNWKDATCTESKTCSDCGKKDGDPLDHNWDNGVVTKKATTTATGIKTFTCETCKETRTETIPKLAKKANPLKVKGKTASVKYKKLKKKTQTLKVSKVIKFTKKGQGKMSYKKSSVTYTEDKSVKMSKKALKKYKKKIAKKIKINASTGKVTVKKGLKKGTYKVKAKVKAAGNANYKASGWKTVTFKIKVR